jgi:hypothetical protein
MCNKFFFFNFNFIKSEVNIHEDRFFSIDFGIGLITIEGPTAVTETGL